MTSIEQLATIAEIMNSQRFDKDATVSYDLMSDALVWSDEFPQLFGRRLRDFWCIRPVLRHRTLIIISKLDHVHELYWKEAITRFPNWAGFDPSRRDTSGPLAALFAEKREKALSTFAV